MAPEVTMDCLPPDKNAKPAEVCSKGSTSDGINSLDVYLAQAPNRKSAGQGSSAEAAPAQDKPPVKFEELPAAKQKVVEDDYNKKHKGEIPIGDATMDASETIRVRLRRMGGMHADGYVSYKKGSEHYDNVLKHIGGIKPGEVKLVAPWPDEKPAQKNAPQNKKGGG